MCFSSCAQAGPDGGCLATIGSQGWMKAAGAFIGRPRELRHNMLPIQGRSKNYCPFNFNPGGLQSGSVNVQFQPFFFPSVHPFGSLFSKPVLFPSLLKPGGFPFENVAPDDVGAAD
jgi:hypothetical protein